MGADFEPKIITRKVKIHPDPMNKFHTAIRVVKLRVGDENNVPPTLPDGTPLLTEEENRKRQSGTGSQAAHIAQALEEKEE